MCIATYRYHCNHVFDEPVLCRRRYGLRGILCRVHDTIMPRKHKIRDCHQMLIGQLLKNGDCERCRREKAQQARTRRQISTFCDSLDLSRVISGAGAAAAAAAAIAGHPRATSSVYSTDTSRPLTVSTQSGSEGE